ncbi:class I glutamine amidotransferase-like protein [Lasiosphaeria ovina]|uniref:Class I glutamine amidotransferase-like protein n=1 Tax=Lasiosphaeria ovina TaxID=92902 RepID=A0AAE0JW25_9PEZI|nr:class I glutamine amidotransferase-like protein [Lasiosphaeria ovina]
MNEAGPIEDFGYMVHPTIVATHSFGNAPALDVLLVPGGIGNVALEQANNTSVEDFIRQRYPKLDYLVSVCTGAGSLAKAGVLEGRRATSNKGAWDWVTKQGTNVTWVPSARWVVDGNIWTSSGVSAGIDMAYAFMSHVYGADDQALIDTMNGIEYAPHLDAHWDPFSVVHKVPGADYNRNLTDCVKPVGY